MEDVKVPAGWEANLCYNDGSKWYLLYIKRQGETFFKEAGMIAPAHTPQEERLKKAEIRAAEWIRLGF